MPSLPPPTEVEVEEVLTPPWSRWVQRLLLPAFFLLFFGVIPFIWSMATGYTFNWRSLTFAATAVLALDTSPPGASVEVNGTPLEKTTPLTLERLRPGRYHLSVTAPGYYPWRRTIALRGKEARAFTDLQLVPKKPLLTQLFDEALTDFWMEKDGTILMRLAEGGSLESLRGYGAEAFLLSPMPPALQGTNHDKVSPDETALLRWTPDRVWLVSYTKEPWKRWGMAGTDTLIYEGHGNILNAFWQKDSRHLVIVTTGAILLTGVEQGTVQSPVTVQRLIRPLPLSYYDAARGWLFFAEADSPWKTDEWVLKRLDVFTPYREETPPVKAGRNTEAALERAPQKPRMSTSFQPIGAGSARGTEPTSSGDKTPPFTGAREP